MVTSITTKKPFANNSRALFISPYNGGGMASINRVKPKGDRITTHEGAPATTGTPYQELKRAVMATMLFEPTYYEKSSDRAQRIIELCKIVEPAKLRDIAIEGRTEMYVRHAPLLVAACLAAFHPKSTLIRSTVCDTIQRADELSEIALLYNFVIGGSVKLKLSRQMNAFHKFDAYQLGKYNRKSTAKVTLKDIMCLTHPKPITGDERETYRGLKTGTLSPPDTWEVALSSGADKRETFTRLLIEGKLGYMALLRNLRNMEQAEVDTSLVVSALTDSIAASISKVLPFRFIPAFLNVKNVEIRKALLTVFQSALANTTSLDGMTYIMVDVSASMSPPHDYYSRGNEPFEGREAYNGRGVSAKPYDRAIALAEAIRASCTGGVRLFAFSAQFGEVAISPDSNFMSVWETTAKTVPNGATYLMPGVDALNRVMVNAGTYRLTASTTRMIVLTDEQASDVGQMSPPMADYGYVINVNGYQPTVANEATGWHSITGWSDKIVDYIMKFESE